MYWLDSGLTGSLEMFSCQALFEGNTGQPPVPVPNDYLNAVILKLGVYPLALNSSNLALSAGVLLTTPASSGIAAIVKTYIEPYTGFNLPASRARSVKTDWAISSASCGERTCRSAARPIATRQPRSSASCPSTH